MGRITALLKSKFFKDTARLEVGHFIQVSTYVLTSMLLARSLGPADLGRYDLAMKIYTFCFFLTNMGLLNVAVVHYSQSSGRRDQAGQTQALASFLKLALIMAAAILVLGYFLCPMLCEKIYHSRLVGWYGWGLCLLGLFDIMRAMVVAALLGTRRMTDVALLESTVAVVRVLALVLAVVGGFELAGVIYGSIAHGLLSTCIAFRFYHLFRKEELDRPPPAFLHILRAIPRARLKQFMSLGLFIALNKNMMELVMIFGTFFMGTVSWSDTGFLRIATILMWGLQLLLGGVARNLLPTLGFKMGEKGEQDVSRMGKTLFKVACATGVVFMILTACFLLVLPWIVRIVYGAEYEASIGLVWILSASHLFIGFGVIIEPFYIYAGRIKTSVAINVVLFSLIVPAGYFAMERYGDLGVAWYMAAGRSLLIVHLVYIFFYYRKRRKQRAGESP